MIGLQKELGALLIGLGAATLSPLAAATEVPAANPPSSFPAPPAAKATTAQKAQPAKKAVKKKTSVQKKSQKKAKLRKTKRQATYVAPATAGQKLGLRNTRDELDIKSSVALVVDQQTGQVLYAKNADAELPIASLTKLMTALIVVEAGLPLDQMLEITREDVDTEKHSQSRLAVGTKLSREDMLLLALMSSENRAASALGRHYPGGKAAFVMAMNRRASSLGMKHSRFSDSTGLSARNVSTAEDLVRLTNAAYQHALIRDFSVRKAHTVKARQQRLQFGTSNRLVRSGGWDIGLQKTGFTNEAGRCLIMQATVDDRPLAMVFLDSTGTLTRYGDASRVRTWLRQQGNLDDGDDAFERVIAKHASS
jgi:D-alanyl-D-alanine endopeptidase (penicillin-binding protein 7)